MGTESAESDRPEQRTMRRFHDGRWWVAFGTHAADELCAHKGKLTFDGEGEDGLPDWERHADGTPCLGR